MRKKPLVIVAAIVCILVLLVLVLPLLINVNTFRPTLESELSSSLSRKVDIGNIRLALFSGGIALDDIAISDDPAFSRSPFLKAKSLTVGVDLIPLIFSRKLQVRTFTVDEPQVELLHSSSGAWNFSSLGASSKPKKSAPSGTSATDISVDKLAIKNGRITVGSVGSGAKKSVYEDVNLEASNLSYTSEFPFSLTAKAPGNGALKLEGKAGPINREDSALTPLHAKIEIQHLDLASTGFIDSSSGLGGLLDFAGNLTSNGRQVNSKGQAKLTKLQLVKGGSPARVPVEINYDSDYDLKRESGVLRQGEVHAGKALAHLAGTYSTSGPATAVQMKLSGQNMPVQDLEGLLPALAVTLPSGASLQGGTLNTDLAISGPVDRLVTTGPINLSNTKLSGFDLGSKMGALGAFAGLPRGSDTLIQTLSASLRVAPEGIRADNLNLIVPAIGNLTGNGIVGSGGALNCKMLAKITSSAGVLGGLSKLTAFGGRQQQNGIPFRIEGTTSNPVFVPDVGGVVGGMMQTPNSSQGAAGLLDGLFGKKKPQ